MLGAVAAVTISALATPPDALAQPVPSDATSAPTSLSTEQGDDPATPPATPPDDPTDVEDDPSPTPTPSPTDTGDETEDEPDEDATATDDPSPAPTTTPQVRPSVRRSGIPVGTVLLAVAVLALAGLLAWVTVRRGGPNGPTPPGGTAPPARTSSPLAPVDDRVVIAFLLDLGEALVDAGDAVDRIGSTLRAVARRQGLRDVGIVVLPTALIISVPGRESLQTDVTAAGGTALRLDQSAAVLRVVDEALDGRLGPTEGRARLAAIRSSTPPVRAPAALAGHALTALGLAMVLRGGPLEVGLAAALGLGVGVLQLVVAPRESSFRPFLPLVAAFLVATSVFLAVRFEPSLEILPPLIAPLIPFLPGGLLTIGTLELATGQAVAGVSRLASGGLRLVLLAGGIIGAAQFVGIPGTPDAVLDAAATGPSGLVGGLLPWVGVALFGIGLSGSRAAPRALLPWMLVILYVAYAAQIVGGLFFGNALSAFFGAFAMTPVAVYAARQKLGPPALVASLPGFWLLVPGALGLEGVTRILSESGIQGLAALVTAGAAMVGIALGILLGLFVAAPETWRPRGPRGRHGQGGRGSGPPAGSSQGQAEDEDGEHRQHDDDEPGDGQPVAGPVGEQHGHRGLDREEGGEHP